MKEKCTKCEKESSFCLFGECLDCRNRREWRAIIILGLTVILLIAGVRLLWAKLVYNDIRCFVAECRIMK